MGLSSTRTLSSRTPSELRKVTSPTLASPSTTLEDPRRSSQECSQLLTSQPRCPLLTSQPCPPPCHTSQGPSLHTCHQFHSSHMVPKLEQSSDLSPMKY